MSVVSAPQRIELSPAVRAILEADTPKSQLLGHFLHFTEALLAPGPALIDSAVNPDARFHELEAIGYPHGPQGFKMFRQQVNAAVPDDIFSSMRYALMETTSSKQTSISAEPTRRRLWAYLRRAGRFASTSTPEADLLTASWLNVGTESTSRTSRASSTRPLGRRQGNGCRASVNSHY